MKCFFKALIITCFTVIGFTSNAQEHYINYYNSIKKFDLSKIWRSTKLHIADGDVEHIDFPEPLGYIGGNYQRFYIHYISVSKDTLNSYRYNITGKTRVNNNICSFTGTITIVKARLNAEPYYGKYKQGDITCEVLFKEDSTQAESGYIKGKLVSNWYLDKKGLIHYDTIDAEADGFSNNQCEAVWTSYKNHQSKQCNWGDFRIPKSENLDGGAGEFMVSPSFIKNGWKNYMDQFSPNKDISKKAVKEESRKWWE